jgi:hypothetical protein
VQKASASGKMASRWGADYWTQIRILFIRALKTRRFDSMSTQDLVQFLVVGVLTGAHTVVSAQDPKQWFLTEGPICHIQSVLPACGDPPFFCAVWTSLRACRL